MNSRTTNLRPVKRTSPSRLTVYFFRGTLKPVKLLQLLVGGSRTSPTHVVYSLDSVSYEILTTGVDVGQSSPEALYRACDDCFTFDLTPEQALFLQGYFSGLKEVGIKFDLWECVRYCWRLLFLNWGCCYNFWEALDFGQVARTQPYEACYRPPFSCTTPMWEALGEQPPVWNAFVPAVLYDHLTNATYTEVQEL